MSRRWKNFEILSIKWLSFIFQLKLVPAFKKISIICGCDFQTSLSFYLYKSSQSIIYSVQSVIPCCHWNFVHSTLLSIQQGQYIRKRSVQILGSCNNSSTFLKLAPPTHSNPIQCKNESEKNIIKFTKSQKKTLKVQCISKWKILILYFLLWKINWYTLVIRIRVQYSA